MKRGILAIFVLVFLLQLVLVESLSTCDLDATLLSQDPYPAVPGEQVKLVFQVTGISNPDCGDVSINIVDSFPFKVAPEPSPIFKIKSGIYVKDFSSFVLVPYKVNINKDALDGESQLELNMNYARGNVIKKFAIEISDSRTDFEVSVKEYNPTTNILTFQILNIGENDVDALTIDILNQENMAVKGSSRNIVGSLDSNDDTTFSFEGIPKDGNIDLILVYTDGINERRTLEKIVSFDSKLFEGRGVKEGRSIWFYITIVLVLIWLFMGYRNRKNKKKHPEH